MPPKVVLAGGTGFLGQYFEEKFKNMGYQVLIISRQPQHISWNDQPSIIDALENSELLINLAGKSVNCRYNEDNKREIMNSRTETTTILGECILQCSQPPQVWMNSSTATIYRHADDRPMTEENGEIGSGFSVEVAKAWEEAFFGFKLPATRQIALRIAVVLGDNGGVMIPYKNLVKFGLGGAQGPGNQMFSWVHIEDVFQVVLFLKNNQQLSGVFNVSAPHPVPNREFMKELRLVLNRNFGLPSPRWMLELGAVMIKTETELVLKSRWVLPDRLEKQGYQFKFPKLSDAFGNILQ